VIYADPRTLEHDPTPHPESPDRLRAVLDALDDRDLPTESAPPADEATLAAVHDPSYLADVRTFCEAGGGRWDADTVAVEATWEAARLSAGLAVAAVESAAPGEPTVALARPPGHHATSGDAGGFCFLNNVAVGVERALDREGIDRAAVIDWDVHHGNGTQAHFLDRADVCYASIHARERFPATGDADETGVGDGTGTTLHCPLSDGFGDEALLAVYDRVVDPAIRRFDPDLVAVSAGFDAHRRDPLSRATVTTDGFRSLAALVGATTRDLGAAGPAVVLEGGYDPPALAESVLATRDALVDRETPTIAPPDTAPNAAVDLVDEQRRRFDL